MADRWLTDDEQRCRVRIAALVFEQDLIERIEAGESGLADQVEDVQKTLARVKREPPFSESTTLEQHRFLLAKALEERANRKAAEEEERDSA